MGGYVTRYIIASCLCLTLVDCANHDHLAVPGDSRNTPIADSENMRAVTGQAVTVPPLTPEPGDVWADPAFLKRQESPKLQRDHEAHTTGSTVAAETTVQPGQQAGAASPARPERPFEPPTPNSPAAGTKSFYVQLAAASSEDAARTEWRQLRRRMPDLISGRVASVMPAKVDGHVLWRLRTGGFMTRADAVAFCGLVRSKLSSCWVVSSVS